MPTNEWYEEPPYVIKAPVGDWWLHDMEAVLAEQRRRTIVECRDLVEQSFKHGHGGGNWRRLHEQLLGEIDRLAELHGGDKGYADLDWKLVQEILEEEQFLIIAEVEKLVTPRVCEGKWGCDDCGACYAHGSIERSDVLDLIRKRGV